MTNNEDKKHALYHAWFKAGQEHNQPSQKTLELFSIMKEEINKVKNIQIIQGKDIEYIRKKLDKFVDSADNKYADKAFEVFYRLHKEDEYAGSGVGLGIVKRIINRCGGEIWAEGKVNEGAAFYFTLPDAEPEIEHD